MTPAPHDHDPANHPSFGEAVRTYAKIGLISFGGPAGQIALMHRIFVDEKRWIGNERFLHALNYCTLLPGPEAQQLATYVGWLLHGTPGGLAAGTLFIIPGFVVVMGLSALYAALHRVPAVDALFYGLKAAVLAVVVEAVINISRKALNNTFAYLLAAASFAAIFLFKAPFPLVVLAAAILGATARRTCAAATGNACAGGVFAANRQAAAKAPGGAAAASAVADAILETDAERTRPTMARSLRVLAVWLPLWLGPVALLGLALGGQDTYTRIAVFFSKMAVVTFGGAYAVLAYVAQEAVQHYQWLSADDMLTGLGLAETRPGPLILVLQFVGFLAAYRDPGALPPLLAGILGGTLTVWVTFAPCFLWIFLGAPYIERVRNVAWLKDALAGVTAAVVGVVLNLAVWFSLNVIFGPLGEAAFLGARIPVPNLRTLDPAALVLAVGATIAMLRYKVGMITTLAAAALLGFGWKMLAGG